MDPESVLVPLPEELVTPPAPARVALTTALLPVNVRPLFERVPFVIDAAAVRVTEPTALEKPERSRVAEPIRSKPAFVPSAYSLLATKVPAVMKVPPV